MHAGTMNRDRRHRDAMCAVRIAACALTGVLFWPLERAYPQVPDAALHSMVRIVGSRQDTPVRGSGFVVALDGRSATFLTSSHVVAGAKFEVTFGADRARSFSAEVVAIETENRHGLAVCRVRGVPAPVTALELETDAGPSPGQRVFVIGFAQMSATPLVAERSHSGRSGSLYVIDQEVGEGSSGGPVILNGKVVALVTAIDGGFTYAVPFASIREFLVGSGVTAGVAASPLSGMWCGPFDLNGLSEAMHLVQRGSRLSGRSFFVDLTGNSLPDGRSLLEGAIAPGGEMRLILTREANKLEQYTFEGRVNLPARSIEGEVSGTGRKTFLTRSCPELRVPADRDP